MRGNGGNVPGAACCSCDSPPDQSIPSSMSLSCERNGPAAPPSNHLGKRPRPVVAASCFVQPKTVLHVVVYKFRDNVSNYDRERAINGIKEMAGKIPGIKNVWLKTSRNQIKDFSGVYAIEFTSAEAAADYAESPVHEAWSKTWQEQRENSLSFQIANP